MAVNLVVKNRLTVNLVVKNCLGAGVTNKKQIEGSRMSVSITAPHDHSGQKGPSARSR